MKIGALRHRVVLQKKSVTEDAIKQQTEVWTDYAYIWACIEPLSGREYFVARNENAEITAKITMRYIKGVMPDMRVIFGNAVYEIEAVINPKGLNQSLVLMCKEVLV